ncbi:DgyrCDS9311 [Dimorphilus gyrociliatus]|uniref:DgyrCDS9311 n=1 Tax=Dimorphilus gyrociliatus TaxID=2664684 RepID=A0A7I8VWZ1_9ANNE|nr:DgyrCDS9311 [Dimorphilus gyrociliatus]
MENFEDIQLQTIDESENIKEWRRTALNDVEFLERDKFEELANNLKANPTVVDSAMAMEDVETESEVEKNLRKKLTEYRKQFMMEKKFFDISLQERQLAFVLSSTDIQRILGIATEEQQIAIERAQNEDNHRKDAIVQLQKIQEERAEIERKREKNILDYSIVECEECKKLKDEIDCLNRTSTKSSGHIKTLLRLLDLEMKASLNLKTYTKKLEMVLGKKAEDYRRVVDNLKFGLKCQENEFKLFKESYKAKIKQLFGILSKLEDERKQTITESIRIRKENESIIKRRDLHLADLNTGLSNFPSTIPEYRLCVAGLRDEVVKSRTARDHIEEQLTSKLLEIKQQIHEEQLERSRVEEDIRLELLKTQKELENTYESKKQIEGELHQLKHRILVLQDDLNNSECVQRDFVKLSQSLQIQLEKERSKTPGDEKWQRIKEENGRCNECGVSFTPPPKKALCEHCRLHFCPDCLPHSIVVGPFRREEGICRPCFSLLPSTSVKSNKHRSSNLK